MEKLLWAVLAAMLIFLGFVAWDDYHADKYEIRKDEWSCTQHKTVPSFMFVGKVMVPTSRQECVAYERKM
jgi:hypothetical protein